MAQADTLYSYDWRQRPYFCGMFADPAEGMKSFVSSDDNDAYDPATSTNRCAATISAWPYIHSKVVLATWSTSSSLFGCICC